VGRLRGTGKRKPILLLVHTDVVDARREDWSFDPFKLTERELGVVGGAALAANAACAVLLYAYRGGDANMQSVWICSRNDVLGNLAVLLAALGVFGTGTGWPDLIVEVIMAIWRCRAPSW
jgi:Co/Zn/Cd efflux system component